MEEVKEEVKDVDLAPDIDEERVLTEEDLKETTKEETEKDC